MTPTSHECQKEFLKTGRKLQNLRPRAVPLGVCPIFRQTAWKLISKSSRCGHSVPYKVVERANLKWVIASKKFADWKLFSRISLHFEFFFVFNITVPKARPADRFEIFAFKKRVLLYNRFFVLNRVGFRFPLLLEDFTLPVIWISFFPHQTTWWLENRFSSFLKRA